MLKLIVLISVLFAVQTSWASKTYVLSDIQQQSSAYTGSTCNLYKNTQGKLQKPDFRCGQKVSLVISNKRDQVAFLGSQNKTFDLFHSSILKRNSNCDETLPVEIKGQAIFESRLCRAFRSEKLSTSDTDVYVFLPNMKPESVEDADPLTDAIARAIVTGSVTGIPIGVASMDTITLSRSDIIPEQVIIENTRISVALFAKVVTHRQFIFQKIDL